MSNYYLTDFKSEHLEHMNEHEEVALVRLLAPGVAKLMEESNSCFTLMRDGEPIGCGGVNTMWPGVGEAWVALLDDARACPLRVVRLCRNGMKEIVKRNHLHRTQAAVRQDDPRAVRFARFFGFEYEGPMKQFTQDQADCYRFAKIWPS